MGEDLIVIIVAFGVLALYCKILDKLGLKERTKQIALLIPHGVMVICVLIFNISIRMKYFSSWITSIYVCFNLVVNLLKFYKKSSLQIS